MADFNPDDLAEISARLRRAEIEETSSVCLYLEMPYTEANRLVNNYNAWIVEGDPNAWALVALFTESLIGSLEQVLNDYDND